MVTLACKALIVDAHFGLLDHTPKKTAPKSDPLDASPRAQRHAARRTIKRAREELEVAKVEKEKESSLDLDFMVPCDKAHSIFNEPLGLADLNHG